VGRTAGSRGIEKLTALEVQRLKAPGYHGDGGGLWLQVSPSGTKSWVFRYTLGKAREMGLGALHTVSLADARIKARACRQQLLEGVDPIEARNAGRLAERAAAAKAIVFQTAGEAYVEAHRAGWKNLKHADQWANTLETYAYPVLGKLPVAAVDTGLVMQVLEPIWRDKTETASRLRGRIECVLDWATVRGYRTGDNPARWRGHLDNLLPKPTKVAKVRNHPALPYAEIGAFMKQLRAEAGLSAKALELIILTAARTSEVIGATWREFDLDAKLWTVPAARMKSDREHRVPLSAPAVRLLRELQKQGSAPSAFAFPGAREKKHLSNMACLTLLARMGRDDITVHGFRSTFRDWAAEQTNHPREVAEMALAHTIKDATEAAYRRGDLFEKRARLMDAWATYCGRVASHASVTPIATRKKQAA
jgi:integrase